MPNAPLYTKLATVFDPSILYPGRPVKLAGLDELGDELHGNYLVFECDYERVKLLRFTGSTLTLYIDHVLRPEYPAIIIPYPEVKIDADPRQEADAPAEDGDRCGQS